MKSSKKWRAQYASALNKLIGRKTLQKGIAVYNGDTLLQEGEVLAMPAERFSKWLWDNLGRETP
ncbi:MAG: hypothetical protein KDD70_08555 [Bdellovibrionales bacterium]|nr:hypothetical protein [Bdellovibrionales bacterium]